MLAAAPVAVAWRLKVGASPSTARDRIEKRRRRCKAGYHRAAVREIVLDDIEEDYSENEI